MKRKLALLLSILSFILVFSPLSVHAKDYEDEESLSSENIVVYNIDMGFSVYRKNQNEKVAPGYSFRVAVARGTDRRHNTA